MSPHDTEKEGHRGRMEPEVEAGLGPVLQLAVLDPPAPGEAAIGGQGALQVDARVWHLHVIANRLPVFGHQAEGCGWDLAADASCNVSHLDPVKLSDVQVFAIERLYLDFHTVKVARGVSGPPRASTMFQLELRASAWLPHECTPELRVSREL